MPATNASASAPASKATPFPKIKDGRTKQPDNERGELTEIDKHLLNVDDSYQRTFIIEARVNQIAESGIIWAAFGTLVVARRADGSLWIIDGQHRYTAAMRVEAVKTLPCNVFQSRGIEHEASEFIRINCHRGIVLQYDQLRGLVASGDQVSCAAVRLMESTGYHPARGEERNGIRCLGKFLRIMRNERALLEKVFPLVAQLHAGLPIRERVFTALLYIAKHGTDDLTRKEWKARVLHRGFDSISGAIDKVAHSYTYGATNMYAIGALDAINYRVKASQKMRLRDTTVDK